MLAKGNGFHHQWISSKQWNQVLSSICTNILYNLTQIKFLVGDVKELFLVFYILVTHPTQTSTMTGLEACPQKRLRSLVTEDDLGCWNTVASEIHLYLLFICVNACKLLITRYFYPSFLSLPQSYVLSVRDSGWIGVKFRLQNL